MTAAATNFVERTRKINYNSKVQLRWWPFIHLRKRSETYCVVCWYRRKTWNIRLVISCRCVWVQNQLSHGNCMSKHGLRSEQWYLCLGTIEWGLKFDDLCLFLSPGFHKGAVWDLDPSWDSQYLLTACADGQARLFEATTGNYIARMPHRGFVLTRLE